MGKSTINNGVFSTAMLVYQRVKEKNIQKTRVGKLWKKIIRKNHEMRFKNLGQLGKFIQ